MLAENTKIYILLMVSHMGASRFEFSTKFGLTDCMWHLSNIYKRIDFSTAKNANLPSKSHCNETWDDGSKFLKSKFCQNWLGLRQINCRYHLSTFEITLWAKNPKIFFKHLKALCPGPLKVPRDSFRSLGTSWCPYGFIKVLKEPLLDPSRSTENPLRPSKPP